MFFSTGAMVAITGAYLIGSFSSAILTCKLMHLPDPRQQGSNNPGATNVLRFGGKKAAILTLLGDSLKGVIPVLVARHLHMSPEILGAVAFAAFIGHLYPIYFSFKGGKGVATAFGSFIALAWPLGLSVICTWLVVAFSTRFSSLAALISALLAPLFALWFAPQAFYFVLSMTGFLLWRHRQNIRNLLSGKEKKIGKA